MMSDNISEVIPVKNEEAKIMQCLEAVFSQSLKPHEVLVVDGHSTDRTVERAREFPARVVYEDYGTVGGARQVGVLSAESGIVAFTDADCVPEKNWLEDVVKEFDEGIVGVGCGIKNDDDLVAISVVVPVYNGEKTIKKTIEALLSQKTEKKYEIIIVDDGSTDNTPNIIKKYPIKTITQKNAGPAAARNIGWKASSGKIVAFTDSDCVPIPDWIEAISKHFNDPAIGGVGGTYKMENIGNILATYIGEDIKFRHDRLGKEIEAVGTFSVAFRKNLLERVGGFDETYKKATAEDFDLCFAIRKTGHKIIYEPNAIVGHYHKESFLKYIKSQFWFSVWRIYLYDKYKCMAKGDRYTPITTLIQVPVTLLFLLSLVLGVFIEKLFIISIFLVGVLLMLTIPFISYEIRKNPLIAVIGVFMQFIRNIIWAVGFVGGLVNLFYLKFEKCKKRRRGKEHVIKLVDSTT